MTVYTWLVISSMVGPVEQASGSGPLRVTLPTEAVMVSIYVMPVISSFTMWLELTLEIPGVATNPMGIAPTGMSRSTSTSSGVCKQAVTPEKPCSGVGGCTNTKAWVGGEGWGGVGVLRGETGCFIGIIWESWLYPTFSLGVLVGWGISLVATTGWDGYSTFSHPKNFGAFSSGAGSGAQCVLETSVAQRVCGLSSSSFSGSATPPPKDLFISKGEAPFHLFSHLQYAFCQ